MVRPGLTESRVVDLSDGLSTRDVSDISHTVQSLNGGTISSDDFASFDCVSNANNSGEDHLHPLRPITRTNLGTPSADVKWYVQYHPYYYSYARSVAGVGYTIQYVICTVSEFNGEDGWGVVESGTVHSARYNNHLASPFRYDGDNSDGYSSVNVEFSADADGPALSVGATIPTGVKGNNYGERGMRNYPDADHINERTANVAGWVACNGVFRPCWSDVAQSQTHASMWEYDMFDNASGAGTTQYEAAEFRLGAYHYFGCRNAYGVGCG